MRASQAQPLFALAQRRFSQMNFGHIADGARHKYSAPSRGCGRVGLEENAAVRREPAHRSVRMLNLVFAEGLIAGVGWINGARNGGFGFSPVLRPNGIGPSLVKIRRSIFSMLSGLHGTSIPIVSAMSGTMAKARYATRSRPGACAL